MEGQVLGLFGIIHSVYAKFSLKSCGVKGDVARTLKLAACRLNSTPELMFLAAYISLSAQSMHAESVQHDN